MQVVRPWEKKASESISDSVEDSWVCSVSSNEILLRGLDFYATDLSGQYVVDSVLASHALLGAAGFTDVAGSARRVEVYILG
jgi:hypothetical protein